MRLDLLYPSLPPTLNGIGDYTAHLARALTDKHVDVRVLTSRHAFDPIPNVEAIPAYSAESRRGIMALYDVVAAHRPDWLVVQFEQFSYGRWGLNPYLPLVLQKIRRHVPETRIALMAHEDYVSATERPQFALMALWQRPQFWALGHLADHVFLSIEAWARRYQKWFAPTPVEHLPVGSNIPRRGVSPIEARAQFQLPPDAFVVGMFGGASRQLNRIQDTLRSLHAHRPDTCALYVGAYGAAFREGLPAALPFHDLGPQPPEAVSAAFEAMDLYLAPFQEGVSTRRGSFLVGLQHEVPTLSTFGGETDAVLLDANTDAFALVPWDDPTAFCAAAERLAVSGGERTRMGRAGGRFFDHTFTWPRIADRLLTALSPSPVLDGK